MIKRQFFTAQERPDLVPIKEPRTQHHTPATCWEEVAPHNRALFIQAAESLRQQYPESKLYAFGSRVNGNWSEDSDVDIVCHASGFKRLKIQISESLCADCFPFVPSNLLIEIP